MSNLQETNRVLSRIGARQLNDGELQQVAGGFVVSKYVTGACVFDPIACRVISGDCNKIPRLAPASSPHPKSTNLHRPAVLGPFLLTAGVTSESHLGNLAALCDEMMMNENLS